MHETIAVAAYQTALCRPDLDLDSTKMESGKVLWDSYIQQPPISFIKLIQIQQATFTEIITE